MSKYGNPVGVWEIEVNGVEYNLRPTVKDYRQFRRMMFESRKTKDTNALFDTAIKIFVDMVKRQPEHAPDNEDEETQLADTMELNINYIFDEMMIAFGWSSREDKAKVEQLQSAAIKKKLEGDL